MPFKTKYNEDIAKRVHRINKDFVDEFQHEGNDSSNFLNLGIPADTKGYAPYKNMVASGSSGGSIYSRAKKIYDTGKYLYDEAGQLYKKPLSRGLHHASRLADYYGYGHPDHLEGGLSWGDTLKGMAGFGKKQEMAGGRISDIGHSLSNIAGAFGLGKKRKSKKQKDGEISESDEEENKKKKRGGRISDIGHSLSNIAGAFGLGKKRKSKKQQMEEMAGGGPISGIGHSLSNIAGAFGLGKKRKSKKQQMEEMAGGRISDIGHSISNIAGAFGLGKKARKGKGAGVFKPEFEAGPMRGGVHITADRAVDRNTINGNIGGGRAGAGSSGGKKVNKRAEIVKQVMKKNGCSMIEASKYVKQHNLY